MNAMDAMDVNATSPVSTRSMVYLLLLRKPAIICFADCFAIPVRFGSPFAIEDMYPFACSKENRKSCGFPIREAAEPKNRSLCRTWRPPFFLFFHDI
jgi:hypothetical protein